MTKTIYTVGYDAGEYSDQTSNCVIAFTSLDKADELCDKLNNIIEYIKAICDELQLKITIENKGKFEYWDERVGMNVEIEKRLLKEDVELIYKVLPNFKDDKDFDRLSMESFCFWHQELEFVEEL